MAILIDPGLIRIYGRVGNQVYRRRNGKIVVSIRPSKYITKSEKVKSHRKNFGKAAQFAKAVTFVEELKKIWSSAGIASSAFHAITKMNVPAVKDGMLTLENMITPPGLYFHLRSLSIKDNYIDVSFDIGKNQEFKFPVVFYIFICFNHYLHLMPGTCIIDKPAKNGVYDCHMEIPHDDFMIAYANDPHPVLYFAVSGKPIEKNYPYWTSTTAATVMPPDENS